MQFIKRMSIYLLFLLLFLSIYKDLTTDIPKNTPQITVPQNDKVREVRGATGIKIQVHSGDTVLSVVEQLNKDNQTIKTDITRIIADFEKVNPHVDPYNLKSNNFYYFPLYNDST